MQWRLVALGLLVLWGWGLLLMSCLPAMASSGGNCVAYAREVTGVHLDGDAASWWPHAEGRYDRGHRPSVGAILVFKPYGRMHVGHVAVVSRVVGAREVLVDQANWVRGRVTRSMSVVDASTLNDWTSVKVLEPHSGTHGRENPTYGFIYPRIVPASFGETIVEPQVAERNHPTHRDRSTADAQQDKRRPGHDDGHKEMRQAAAYARDNDRQAHKHAAKADTAAAPHKDRHEPAAATAAGAETTSHRVAAAERTHHTHKVPDAKVVYVY